MVLALVVSAATRAGFCTVDSMGFFFPRFNASGRWAPALRLQERGHVGNV
jgi:hypothetical protein